MVAAVSSHKIIISFNNQECEQLGLSYAKHLSEKARKLTSLHHIGMLIVDIDLLVLTKFASEFKEFRDCVSSFEEDKEITFDYPKPVEVSAESRDQWHLKRINVKTLPLPSTVQRRISSSAPVHVIVIDSGIDGKHPDLSSRVAPASEHFSLIDNDVCCSTPSDPLCDCAEHGTHCSGLVASPKAGYNPSAILHSVKVFDKQGQSSFSIILQGMDKAISLSKLHPGETYIASMSLGGSLSTQINAAAQKLVTAGIFLVVAAGNETQNACLTSPASSPAAFTVGASEIDDSIAYFSNYGACVNIFAPGSQINSCKPGGGYQYLSGTSMATPIVAGFASAIAASEGLSKPSDIRAAINNHISKNTVTNAKSTNNNLPYDGTDSDSIEFLE